MRQFLLTVLLSLSAVAAWAQLDSIPSGAVLPGNYTDRVRLWTKGDSLRRQANRFEGAVGELGGMDTLAFTFRLNGALFIDTETVRKAEAEFVKAFNLRISKRYRKSLVLVTDVPAGAVWKSELAVYSVHEPDCETAGLFCLSNASGVVAVVYDEGYGAYAATAEENLPLAAAHAGAYLADALARILDWGR